MYCCVVWLLMYAVQCYQSPEMNYDYNFSYVAEAIQVYCVVCVDCEFFNFFNKLSYLKYTT